MKRSRSMKVWMIAIAGTVVTLTTIQPAGAPGNQVAEKTVESVTLCGSSSGMTFYFQVVLCRQIRLGGRKIKYRLVNCY